MGIKDFDQLKNNFIRFSQHSFKEKLFFVLILIFFILFFIPSMTRSLWIDETITYWVIKDGFRDVFYRAIHFQGQSPFYYLIVWCFIQVLGHTEWVLRLPSLLALIVACIFLYKLGLLFFNREGGLISALGFISLWALIGQLSGGGCSARPYELAVMFSILSVFCFVLWIKTGQTRHQIAYIIASAATCYAHILFAPILFVHFCYFLINRENGSKVSFSKLFLTFGLVGLSLLPNAYQLMLLIDKKGLLSIPTIPSVINLIYAWFPRGLFIPLIAAFLITRIIEKKMYWRRTAFFSKQFLFFLIWFFFPALFWFITSIISGNSLFLYRYYCWSSSAIALVIASLIISVAPERARTIAVVSFSMLFILTSIICPKPLEDWRAATDYVNANNISNKGPVLLWPGLIEQGNWQWSKKSDNQNYLLAPFSFYSIQKKAILVPLIPDKFKLEELLSEHDIPIKKQKDDFFLMVRNIPMKEKTMQKDQASQIILENWLKRQGFLVIQKKSFGGVVVSQFVFNPDT